MSARIVRRDRSQPPRRELGPPPSTGAALDRLIAEGRVSRPARRGLPEPLAEPALRALDAIHVTAAAVDVSPLDAFVSYDKRESAAARLAGLRTVAPGA